MRFTVASDGAHHVFVDETETRLMCGRDWDRDAPRRELDTASMVAGETCTQCWFIFHYSYRGPMPLPVG